MEEATQTFVIHYGEIALRGGNRPYFERKLAQNIKRCLKSLGQISVERIHGRFVVRVTGEASEANVIERLQRVFGIISISPAQAMGADLEKIKSAALNQVRGLDFETFRVDAHRAQKTFPQNSMEINRVVGAHIQEHISAGVDLTNPDETCYIEVVDKQAFVYARKVRGPGGLPTGVGEKAVSLLSSGIDSPVASYKVMRRGVKLVFVHLHSQPYTSDASQRNVERLVELLTKFQLHAKCYFVSFAEIQQKIMVAGPPKQRVLLYRRSMMRLAELVAVAEKAKALITGENLGQVASQTLSNIRAVADAVALPIIRPLAGEDKVDIMALARRIGTYDISIEPDEDCCSLFVPRNPETKAHLPMIQSIDKELDLGDLEATALASAEVRNYRAE